MCRNAPWAFVWAIALLVSAFASSAEAVTPGRRATSGVRLHLLVVTVNNFAPGPGQVPPLDYANADGDAIVEFFQSHHELFSEFHPHRLRDAEVTLEGVTGAIGELRRAVDANDVVAVYFATHGIGQICHDGPQHLLALHPSRFDATVCETTLRTNHLIEMVRAIPTSKKILMLDACQSGMPANAQNAAFLANRAPRSFYVAVEQLSTSSGTSIFSASRSMEDAFEHPDGHGLFTAALLEGLRGDARSRDPDVITLRSLGDFIAPRVNARSDGRQRPVVAFVGDDFAIALTPEGIAHRENPPPVPWRVSLSVGAGFSRIQSRLRTSGTNPMIGGPFWPFGVSVDAVVQYRQVQFLFGYSRYFNTFEGPPLLGVDPLNLVAAGIAYDLMWDERGRGDESSVAFGARVRGALESSTVSVTDILGVVRAARYFGEVSNSARAVLGGEFGLGVAFYDCASRCVSRSAGVVTSYMADESALMVTVGLTLGIVAGGERRP